MDFDVRKVYTAVNADELHKGDLVIVADNLGTLKEYVSGVTTIESVLSENSEYRFRTSSGRIFCLAYLVCPARNAEAYKAWREGKAVEMRIGLGEKDWTVRSCRHNNVSDDEWLSQEFRPVLEEAAARPEPQYRPYKSVDELVSDFKERFDTHTPAYAMPLIWVQRKDKNEKFLITGFTSTEENGELVKIGRGYYGLGVLFDHYTFLDGSPCGVKE